MITMAERKSGVYQCWVRDAEESIMMATRLVNILSDWSEINEGV